MEKVKKPVLSEGAFRSLKAGCIALAALAIAGCLISLAIMDDVKLADKTVRDMDVVTLADREPVNADIFKENTLTVVNVWATFCGPCIREMPEFGEVSREYAGKGVAFLGICGDITYNEQGVPSEQLMKDAFDIIETTRADYLQCMPTPAYVQPLTTLVSGAYPGTFLVDSDGNIRRLFVGSISKEDLVAAIEKELTSLQAPANQ